MKPESYHCHSCNLPSIRNKDYNYDEHTTYLCRKCLEKIHTKYIQLLLQQKDQSTTDNKVLISPDKYNELKEGDEYEITVKGIFRGIEHTNKYAPHIVFKSGSKLDYITNCATLDLSINDPQYTFTIHKILPKATPLVVGEIVRSKINVNNLYEIIAIDCNQFVTKTNSGFAIVHKHDGNTQNRVYRESGVPIDWDAAFKS